MPISQLPPAPTTRSLTRAQFYLSSGKDVRAQLSESSLQLPHYVNLDWRLDVQLGSRALRQQFEPTLMLELETQKPSTYLRAIDREAMYSTHTHAFVPESHRACMCWPFSCLAPLVFADHDGVGSVSSKQVLQMDHANLRHVCAELEDAIAQLKSGHCRRIQKYIR